jgi:hypothetical protein
MSEFWIAVGTAIAIVAVTAPLAAMVLVSIASRREESAYSLSGQAPGPITAVARRLLAYRSDSVAPQRRRSRRIAPSAARSRRQSGQARPSSAARPAWLAVNEPLPAHIPIGEPDLEVRFAHARRSLPDTSQFQARRQPQPGSVRAEQRQTAGV